MFVRLQPNDGFASFVAVMVGAVLARRRPIWILALIMCGGGSAIFRADAISHPGSVILRAYAVMVAIAGCAVLGLRWAPPGKDVSSGLSEDGGSDSEVG